MVRFNAERHEYWIGDLRMPSVTDALSVITNFDNVPREALEAARKFGQQIHHMVHLHSMGNLDEATLHPMHASRLAQWKRFLYEAAFVVEHSEEIVTDASYRYCGTLDMRGYFIRRNRRVSALGDLKSGAVPRTVGMQTAAYQAAVPGVKPRERFALQLSEYGYRLIPCHDASDWAHFLSCLNVYKLTMKDGNPYDDNYNAGRSAA